MLTLTKALRLSAKSAVAFVGAGGKTTAMLQLARELGSAIVTATTHLGHWQAAGADRHFVWEAGDALPDIEAVLGAGAPLITGSPETDTDRFQGLSLTQVEKLRQLAAHYDLPLLIEADGARRKPLKAPGPREPVIPEFVDTAVVVAGLAALANPHDWSLIHRPEIYAHLTGLRQGDRITPDSVRRALLHPQGGLKGIPPGARRIALLNQADSPPLQSAASEIAQPLLTSYDAAIISALGGPAESQPLILAVHEKVAGIILAAGEGRRFGRTKQLLDYYGRPFIRAVAEQALAAGLDPVIVVSGANAGAVEAALTELPVHIVRNPDWPSGQASSIQAGLARLGRLARPSNGSVALRGNRVGAAIFLLADMPQITPEVLRALVEFHACELPPVVAPLVEDRRANPTLFDCITFTDLMQLSGDVGGRAVFSKYAPKYLPWLDHGLLRDVDTPEDYQGLMQHE